MKRIIFIPTLFILAYIITSCDSTKEKIDVPTNMQVTIYDSIDLPDATGFEVYDYNPNQDMFLSISGHDIVGFTKEKESFRFNRFGRGPEEYAYSTFFLNSAPMFDTDTSVLIDCYRDLKYYDHEGNFIKSYRIDTAAPGAQRKWMGKYRDKHVFNGDNTYTDKDRIRPHGTRNPKLPVDYQKAPKFFIASFDSNFTRPYGYLPKESIISQENRAFRGFSPKVAYNKEKERVDILYSADQKLFSFPLDHPDAYSYIQLSPDHISNQLLYPNEKGVSHSEENRLSALNAYYRHFYSQGDTIITIYRPGISEDILDEELPKTKIKNDYYEVINKYLHYYIDYYISGKKQSRDIRVPKGYYPLYLAGIDNIMLGKKGLEITKGNQALRRIYFARLEKKKG